MTSTYRSSSVHANCTSTHELNYQDIRDRCKEAQKRVHDLSYIGGRFSWSDATDLLKMCLDDQPYIIKSDIILSSLSDLLSNLCESDTPYLGQVDSIRDRIVPYCEKGDIHKNQARQDYGEECKSTHWARKKSTYNKFMDNYKHILANETAIKLDIKDEVFHTHILIQQILTLLKQKDYIKAYGSGAGKNKNEAKEILRFLILIIIGIYY